MGTGASVHRPGPLKSRRGQPGALQNERQVVRNRGVARPHLRGFVRLRSRRSAVPGSQVPELGATAPVVAASQRLLTRPAVAWILGIAGLLAYNWWVLVPFKPGLMRSPNELFSNLEVSGQPYAAAMQHADLASGLLLLGAFLVVASSSLPHARREWLAMMAFAAAGALGGLLPEICADGINAVCRNREWTLQLPLDQYLHIAAGIVEFGGITAALLFAFRRTRNEQTPVARAYRNLARAAAVAYPLLGSAYLLNRLGGVMEAVFFAGFTVMVLTQLVERTTALRRHRLNG